MDGNEMIYSCIARNPGVDPLTVASCRAMGTPQCSMDCGIYRNNAIEELVQDVPVVGWEHPRGFFAAYNASDAQSGKGNLNQQEE
mgnify:CR=1 FL=1